MIPGPDNPPWTRPFPFKLHPRILPARPPYFPMHTTHALPAGNWGKLASLVIGYYVIWAMYCAVAGTDHGGMADHCLDHRYSRYPYTGQLTIPATTRVVYTDYGPW